MYLHFQYFILFYITVNELTFLLYLYRVIECKGPTNTRVYTVAVYFRGRRLASAMGHSIQQAEMNAAKKALEISQGKLNLGKRHISL